MCAVIELLQDNKSDVVCHQNIIILGLDAERGLGLLLPRGCVLHAHSCAHQRSSCLLKPVFNVRCGAAYKMKNL